MAYKQGRPYWTPGQIGSHVGFGLAGAGFVPYAYRASREKGRGKFRAGLAGVTAGGLGYPGIVAGGAMLGGAPGAALMHTMKDLPATAANLEKFAAARRITRLGANIGGLAGIGGATYLATQRWRAIKEQARKKGYRTIP